MGKNKIISFVLAAFCSVIVAFFVFSFVDYSASGPAGGTTVENNNEEKGSGETKSNGDGNGNSNITNNVQNDVNGQQADLTNNVENNTNGGNADIDNTIDNQLNNSNNNQIENNVTNNIEVNVNVNVSNNINNDVEGQQTNSESGQNKEGNNESGENGDTSNANNGSNNEDSDGEASEDRILWGVDSASLTTEEMLACVGGNFGSPDIWGRYLGDKEGVSAGLTPEEIELLHANDHKILVIWNHFINATGFEKGQTEAREAIQMAQQLGIPEGVAIFADIEPSYPVDSEFIRGWYETMTESVYPPGIYGVFDAGGELYNAHEQAGANNSELLQNTYIWTAYPQEGITTEANAPKYQPEAPENALIAGWQYGLDAQACNIDTNLFHSDLLDVVW